MLSGVKLAALQLRPWEKVKKIRNAVESTERGVAGRFKLAHEDSCYNYADYNITVKYFWQNQFSMLASQICFRPQKDYC